jgi:hypothetical protein
MNLIIQRIYSVLNLAWYYIAERRKTSQNTKNLEALRGKFSSANALMAANGPSLLNLNFAKLRQLQKSQSIQVFGINYSPLFDLGITPDYLVLSDHYMHPRNKIDFNTQFWIKVNECSEMKLITPANWCDARFFPECSAGKCLHFNDIGAEGLVKGINPLRPRGYLSVTALKALAISDYLGFEEIGVIGLDNTFYMGLKVNQELKMIERAHHASKGQHFNPDLGDFWRLGVSDYFYFVSLNFYYLKKFFSNRRFVNMDRESLVDAFEKITVAHSFSLLVRDESNA